MKSRRDLKHTTLHSDPDGVAARAAEARRRLAERLGIPLEHLKKCEGCESYSTALRCVLCLRESLENMGAKAQERAGTKGAER